MSTQNAPLPDFIVVGAMKCGTSTLQAQLVAQAGVFMTTPKEPNYFSDDAIFAQGQAWYEGLFADAPGGALKGEASTHYTKLPTHPKTLERMQAVLPAVKVVYMIRNPAVRAVSHYIHEWTMRVASHNAEEAFRTHSEFIDYGCYAMQIAPYIDAYGLESICLSSLEALSSDPETEFARIAAFLGLEGAAWKPDLEAQNVSSKRMRRFPLQGLLLDNPVARTLRRTLVPEAVRQKILERRQKVDRPDIPADLQADMHARFLEDRAKLAGFFPDHPALEACYPFTAS